jgi:pilus assembly protein CpaE
VSHIRALVALERGVTQEAVRTALPAGDVEVLQWVQPSSGQTSGKETAADLLIVACSAKSGSSISLIDRVTKLAPDRPVVVLQLDGADSNGFMQQAFAAGADDIVTLPETPERIRHALQKAIARKRGSTLAHGSEPASLVCVLGPKGGTGKTVTACNLSVALAEQGQRVCLVDLDLHFGDVGLGLRLTPERTIYDLARAGGTLDAGKVDDYLTDHESGVRALLAPVRPDHAGAVGPDFIAEVLALLRSMSDFVIVDTPAGFSAEVITAVDNSTDILVVGMLDAFSLKDTKLGLETLDRMGYDRGSIRLVLNRADTHVGIGKDDVAAILDREPDVLVPSQRDIPRTVTQGMPIVTALPKSTASRSFRSLAALYTTAPAASAQTNGSAPVPGSRRKGLLLRRA